MKNITKAVAKKAWQETVDNLIHYSPIKFALIQDFCFESYSNGVMKVSIPHSASGVKDTMFWPQMCKKINESINQRLGQEAVVYYPIQDQVVVTTPCKKPCDKQEETTTELRIVWDHEISEKIYELEARVLASTILLIATLAVSVGNLLAFIFKK